eukprot:CAMPEP_0118940996 /NCGR_PEP_ID=MMETSP1169-20130426/32831_1 /TAXON_ID=36882 /ORGANISM="Pyramimonas obovata, Strain CCMP722" /LENGTH=405 /DNA_ID=CAMNT_0006885645 /DNA_START=499 /DNA_END=1716 /DNA_ORIENTATION=+
MRATALGRGSGLGRSEVCAPRRRVGRTVFHTDGKLEKKDGTQERKKLQLSVLSLKGQQQAKVLSVERTGQDWLETGFPTYLRTKKFNADHDPFCQAIKDTEDAPWKDVTYSEGDVDFLFDPNTGKDVLWSKIREEAQKDADEEPLLSSFLYCSILSHRSFDMALSFVLAQKLASPVLLATHLIDIFERVILESRDIRVAARADVLAAKSRDPACISYTQALLYYKGYQCIQAHRISHALWNSGQKVLALALQSRMSEVFAIDIHPAARMGKGILLDHGTGVVIGETAVIGDRVSILQGVTLGGTGKDDKDRHPKVGEGVLLGANSTILGNIKIGKGSMVAAGSLVLKPVRPYVMMAGSPAIQVGKIDDSGLTAPPAITMKQKDGRSFCEEWEKAVSQQLEGLRLD